MCNHIIIVAQRLKTPASGWFPIENLSIVNEKMKFLTNSDYFSDQYYLVPLINWLEILGY